MYLTKYQVLFFLKERLNSSWLWTCFSFQLIFKLFSLCFCSFLFFPYYRDFYFFIFFLRLLKLTKISEASVASAFLGSSDWLCSWKYYKWSPNWSFCRGWIGAFVGKCGVNTREQLADEQRILLWDYLKLCPFSSQIPLILILLSVAHISFFRFSDALQVLTCDTPQSNQRAPCFSRASTSGKFKKTICCENLRMQNRLFFKILCICTVLSEQLLFSPKWKVKEKFFKAY